MIEVYARFSGGCADGMVGPVEQPLVMVAVVEGRTVALTPRGVSGSSHRWCIYEVDPDGAADAGGRVLYRYMRPA